VTTPVRCGLFAFVALAAQRRLNSRFCAAKAMKAKSLNRAKPSSLGDCEAIVRVCERDEQSREAGFDLHGEHGSGPLAICAFCGAGGGGVYRLAPLAFPAALLYTRAHSTGGFSRLLIQGIAPVAG
jgi:hypothetical protein